VEGIWRLLNSSYVGPMNIGSQAEVSMLELAKRINGLCGGRSRVVHRPLPPDDPKVRRPDSTLARRELGWEPRVPVEEGLLRTRDYFYEALGVRRGSA
jgi:nucleoside-diphosphate-sugar epimerase